MDFLQIVHDGVAVVPYKVRLGFRPLGMTLRSDPIIWVVESVIVPVRPENFRETAAR